MSRRRLIVAALLLLALIATIALRAYDVSHKPRLTHDEVISYMVATGHQGEYHANMSGEGDLAGRWVRAAEWKRLLQAEDVLPLARIARDLAHHDIHPPLYFWLLHVWLLEWDLQAWTGPALNIPIALTTLGVLFAFGRYVLSSSMDAAAASLLWALSPQVIGLSSMARQYDLLALMVVLLAWQAVRFSEPQRALGARDFALLGLTTAAGLLTHYHFTIALSGAGVLVAVRCRVANLWRIAAFAACALVGGVLFWIAHPEFAHNFSRQAGQLQPFTVADFVERIERTRDTFLGFFGWRPWWSQRLDGAGVALVVPSVALLIALAAILSLPRAANFRARWRRAIGSRGFSAMFLLAWTAGAIVALYLAFRSPEHAMGDRYLAMVWPLLSLMPALALRFSAKASICAILSFELLILLPLNIEGRVGRGEATVSELVAGLREPHTVVVDDLQPGHFPRVLMLMHDDSLVLAASKQWLWEHPELWIDHLREGDLYVSILGLETDKDIQHRLLAAISDRYEATPQLTGDGWVVSIPMGVSYH